MPSIKIALGRLMACKMNIIVRLARKLLNPTAKQTQIRFIRYRGDNGNTFVLCRSVPQIQRHWCWGGGGEGLTVLIVAGRE